MYEKELEAMWYSQAAKLMQLANSRTFPGQWYWFKRSMAGVEMRRTLLPVREEKSSRKCSASGKMSPTRSRSGGTYSAKTPRA